MSVDLRPLTLGELLDRVFFLYRKNFLLFVGIVAVPQLVLLAFQFIGVALRTGNLISNAGFTVIWTLFLMLVSLAAVALSQGGTIIAVSKVHLGLPASIAESLSGMKGRIIQIVLIMFGCGIGVGIGFLLLIVPGVILMLMWALTIPVAVLEDKGLSDSVSRSAELTKGHRGRVFVVLLLFLVIYYAVTAGLEVPIFAVIGISMRTSGFLRVPMWTQIAIPIAGFISQCLAGPLMTIGLSLLYYDERVRKEAFDLQQMMATLEAADTGTITPVNA